MVVLLERLIALEILTARVIEDFTELRTAHEGQQLPDGLNYMDVPPPEKDAAKRAILLTARLDALNGRPFENTLKRWWRTRDHLAWEVLDWRDEVHAVRGLLASVAHLMDDPKEIAAKHWTTRLRALLGSLGGAIPASGPPLPSLADEGLAAALKADLGKLQLFTDDLKALGPPTVAPLVTPPTPARTPEPDALRFPALGPLVQALSQLRTKTHSIHRATTSLRARLEGPAEDRFLLAFRYSPPPKEHAGHATVGGAVAEGRARLDWEEDDAGPGDMFRTYRIMLRHRAYDLDVFHLAFREWRSSIDIANARVDEAHAEVDVVLADRSGVPSVLLRRALHDLSQAVPYSPDLRDGDEPVLKMLVPADIEKYWQPIWDFRHDLWSASQMRGKPVEPVLAPPGASITRPPSAGWTKKQLVGLMKPALSSSTFVRIRDAAGIKPGRKGRRFTLEEVRSMLGPPLDEKAPQSAAIIRAAWGPLVAPSQRK